MTKTFSNMLIKSVKQMLTNYVNIMQITSSLLTCTPDKSGYFTEYAFYPILSYQLYQ